MRNILSPIYQSDFTHFTLAVWVFWLNLTGKGSDPNALADHGGGWL